MVRIISFLMKDIILIDCLLSLVDLITWRKSDDVYVKNFYLVDKEYLLPYYAID